MTGRTMTGQTQTGFLRKYLFSLDHKMIGKQYFLLSLCAVLVGVVFSWLMRIHLAWPALSIPGLGWFSSTGAPHGVISPEYYLALMTMHGTLMVFFVLTLAPLAAFGNYFLPIQIGAEEMAFPRLNLLSFWITLIAFVVLISSLFVSGGSSISGWTAYPPLSAVGAIAGPGEGAGQTLWIVSIAIFCVASLLGSINFIATTFDLRCQGMTLMRMPMTVWAWFITSCMTLVAFSVLLPACWLLILDRVAGTSFFIPAGLVISDQLQPHSGGSPLLWQHLFWFFGHPEVYIAILPAMGIVSHVLMASMRRPMLSHKAIIYSMIAIGFLSYVLWGHHMFVSGMNPYSALVFSLPTLVITIPSTIITLIWIGSLYGSKLRITSASLFALGFISVFVSGGVSGFLLAQPSLDTYLHATYFVVGHFHLIMGVAAIFGIFAGTYFWFPKMTGRLMNEPLGKLHFWLTFVGSYCIFMPFYYLGLAGNVRRESQFVSAAMQSLMPIHRFITVAALGTGAAQLVFLYNLVYSWRWGKAASTNPWEATSLEWSIPSPPPAASFGGEVVSVSRNPYQYGIEGAQDFLMQRTEAMTAGTATSRLAPPKVANKPSADTSLSKTGVWIFIAASVMTFAALTSALLVRRGSAQDWQLFRLPVLLYFNTVLLVCSSVVLEIARRSFPQFNLSGPRDARTAKLCLSITLLFGAVFLGGQAAAWLQLRSQGLTFGDGPSSSFFYLLLEAHGVHVLVGLIAMAWVLDTLYRSQLRKPSLETFALYWHFTTALWLYVLSVLLITI
ncbi:MAG TPA: cbb3-type cytochrome c oxidase subunit I [Terriglobales bacterium]|jgi:cytochrome c oxidase subunit 1